jgi:argininosuccinate lyase
MKASGAALALGLLLSSSPLCTARAAGPGCDFFCYMTEANKASLVMLQEGNMISPALAGDIARGIGQIATEQQERGARRWSNYLDFEQRLLEVAGAEASRLHTGRSRQDLHETVRRMLTRDAFLETYDELLDARAALLDLAARNGDTIIPAYTHGVQAQPTSLGHYLLAFSAALGRDADRLQQLYARLNESPLGAAALGTSGFALDRNRLAQLLGFDGPIENSYDANHLSPADAKIEFANILANSAIHVGQFAEDLHAQYRSPRPWLLVDAASTDVSSIMPQKRNPRPIDRLRSLATAVISDAQAVTLAAHNTNTGMNDYRTTGPLFQSTSDAANMYSAWARLVRGLQVDPAAALDEINADYSTMTEVADTLLRNADVPFRVAHHYASELTDYGRSHDKRPMDLSDAEITGVYRDAIGTELPVPAEAIRDAMDPTAMVNDRQGLGGPQPAEVGRMLEAQRAALSAERAWWITTAKKLENARSELDSKFATLARGD